MLRRVWPKRLMATSRLCGHVAIAVWGHRNAANRHAFISVSSLRLAAVQKNRQQIKQCNGLSTCHKTTITQLPETAQIAVDSVELIKNEFYHK